MSRASTRPTSGPWTRGGFGRSSERRSIRNHPASQSAISKGSVPNSAPTSPRCSPASTSANPYRGGWGPLIGGIHPRNHQSALVFESHDGGPRIGVPGPGQPDVGRVLAACVERRIVRDAQGRAKPGPHLEAHPEDVEEIKDAIGKIPDRNRPCAWMLRVRRGRLGGCTTGRDGFHGPVVFWPSGLAAHSSPGRNRHRRQHGKRQRKECAMHAAQGSLRGRDPELPGTVRTLARGFRA